MSVSSSRLFLTLTTKWQNLAGKALEWFVLENGQGLLKIQPWTTNSRNPFTRLAWTGWGRNRMAKHEQRHYCCPEDRRPDTTERLHKFHFLHIRIEAWNLSARFVSNRPKHRNNLVRKPPAKIELICSNDRAQDENPKRWQQWTVSYLSTPLSFSLPCRREEKSACPCIIVRQFRTVNNES